MNKKNQWRVRRLGIDGIQPIAGSYPARPRKPKFCLTNFIRSMLIVLISVLIIFSVVKAGNLTPSASPAATSYTLSDIYTRLTINDTSTEGDHIFAPGASPADTLYTLTEIYNLIPTIVADTVKLDTTYLGIDGTLVPSGTATESDVRDSKTFYSGDSWTQKTGSIADCSTEGGNACYAASGHWTSLLGNNVSGADGSKTFSISDGYYSSKTATCNDTDLSAGNIVSGVNIFGTDGSFGSQEKTATLEGEEVTPDSGSWLSKVTVAITNLIVNVIKFGETVGGVDGALTPVSGASAGLNATSTTCGFYYFGSGADSWTVQEGTGCAVCKECSAGSCANMTNDTQDTTDDMGIAGTCDQTCKKCSGGNCANQASNEDLFSQCGGTSCCGYCDGSGACAYVANSSTCTTPGDSCSGDYKCDGSGTCEYSPWNCGDTLAYEGQNYATVLIETGETDQCWFAEDLNVGTMLCEGGGTTCATEQNNDSVLEKYCYQNNTGYCTSDGAFYQWAEAMDLAYACNADNSCAGQIGSPHQGICPSGWHIPTDTEWHTLESYLWDGVTGVCGADDTGWICSHAGDRLKITSKCFGGVDCADTGFESLLAGYRKTNGSFGNRGTSAYVWSSLQSDGSAWLRYLNSGDADVLRNPLDKLYGFSVRCLKD